MNIYQAGLEKKQALLGRFVEIGTDLFAMAATCSRADYLHAEDPAGHPGVIELADLFCRDARRRIDESFRAARRNHDRASYHFAQTITRSELAWLEKGASEAKFE